MCDLYCTIDLPENLIALDAIDLAIEKMSSKEWDSDLPAKIVIGGIEIFVKSDSNPERLALGYEHEKQKRRANGVLPDIGPIGPYVSDADLDVYISGIIYYATDTTHSAEYANATKEYEEALNRRSIRLKI
jgi:hypothetical protein